jgi:hypothetical protein
VRRQTQIGEQQQVGHLLLKSNAIKKYIMNIGLQRAWNHEARNFCSRIYDGPVRMAHFSRRLGRRMRKLQTLPKAIVGDESGQTTVES